MGVFEKAGNEFGEETVGRGNNTADLEFVTSGFN